MNCVKNRIGLSNTSSKNTTWQQSRVRRRLMDDENAQDERAETPEDDWKSNTFYVSVDAILNSLKKRFEKKQPLLQTFSLFAPSDFSQLVKNFKTAHDLQACLNTFCITFNLTSGWTLICGLVVAYPTLCRVYANAVAIPVISSTAERSFSALKKMKTWIRSSIVQERLEFLLLMSIERKIFLKFDKERLINLYAGLSPELSKALL